MICVKKCCLPDNTDWMGITIPQFIDILNNYLIRYNESRIKNHWDMRELWSIDEVWD